MNERTRLRRIRSRLMRALRCERPAPLRAAVVEVASDIEAMIEGLPVPDEACPVTQRSPPPSPGTIPVDVDWSEFPEGPPSPVQVRTVPRPRP